MPVFADGRIPVTVVADEASLAASLAARPGAALLAEGLGAALPEGAVHSLTIEDAPEQHPAACACCAGRPSLAVALDRLFLARVKGQARWFDRVVALLPDEEARQALASALREDALTVSRYRPEA